ncbi:MAG: lipid A deacylase LpxR family protein [Desulfobacterales bacterium]
MLSIRLSPVLAKVLILLSCLFVIKAACADPSGYIVSVNLENDLFGSGTDRYFTHGSRLQLITKPIPWIAELADKFPGFSKAMALEDPANTLETRTSVALGQNIYTPDNISETELIKDDIPYAGWLYLGFGITANQGVNRFDQLELNIGVVGPSSMAEEVQTEWHNLFDLEKPRGWTNQLNDELGIVLFYEQARRFETKDWMFGLKWDAIPHFGGSIGNVFTFAKIGVTFRLGPDLERDFGPPRIRPSLPGSGFYKPQKGFNWYVFTGGEARLVLQNIFLDGNTFTDSHSVDKKPVVGDIQTGVVFQYDRFRLSYTHVFRSKEFNGQEDSHKYGSLGISYQFF